MDKEHSPEPLAANILGNDFGDCGVRWLIWSLFRQTATAKYTSFRAHDRLSGQSATSIEDWTVITMKAAPTYVCNRRKQTRNLWTQPYKECFAPMWAKHKGSELDQTCCMPQQAVAGTSRGRLCGSQEDSEILLWHARHGVGPLATQRSASLGQRFGFFFLSANFFLRKKGEKQSVKSRAKQN